MNKAKIVDGIVENVIVVDPDNIPDWCADWPDAPAPVCFGWLYEDGEFIAPPPQPAPEPDRSKMSLSFAQLLIGLVTEGWITAEEGRAWRDRTALPPAVAGLIATLPPEQQFAAETRAMAFTEALRLDPLVEALGAAEGKTPEELDAFFTTYAGV